MDESSDDAQTTPDERRAGRRRVRDVTRTAADVLTVRRVFGEPVREGEVTLVPVAKVTGASGSGWGTGGLGAAGTQASSQGEGAGGGFAVRVRPTGVYVVRGSEVSWRPALDLNRVILGGQLVGAVALLVVARALRRGRRRR